MVKVVYCVRRRSGMTLEEFQDRWLNVHGPLVRSLREQIPSMTRYVQSHLVPGEPSEAVRAARGAGEPYDGITEVWLDTDTEGAEGAAEAGRRLFEDELEFIDMENSKVFLTVEHEIF